MKKLQHYSELLQEPSRALAARIASWGLPPPAQLPQARTDDHRVKISGDVAEVTITHIGSQVNHITVGTKAPKAKGQGLLEHGAADDPTSWPELLRESVWGGL